MCMDIPLEEKSKMSDNSVDDDVQIIEAHIYKGKIWG